MRAVGPASQAGLEAEYERAGDNARGQTQERRRKRAGASEGDSATRTSRRRKNRPGAHGGTKADPARGPGNGKPADQMGGTERNFSFSARGPSEKGFRKAGEGQVRDDTQDSTTTNRDRTASMQGTKQGAPTYIFLPFKLPPQFSKPTLHVGHERPQKQDKQGNKVERLGGTAEHRNV